MHTSDPGRVLQGEWDGTWCNSWCGRATSGSGGASRPAKPWATDTFGPSCRRALGHVSRKRERATRNKPQATSPQQERFKGGGKERRGWALRTQQIRAGSMRHARTHQTVNRFASALTEGGREPPRAGAPRAGDSTLRGKRPEPVAFGLKFRHSLRRIQPQQTAPTNKSVRPQLERVVGGKMIAQRPRAGARCDTRA